MIFVDKLSSNIKKKLLSYQESGNGYWITKVKLKNGELYSNIYITTDFQFGFPKLLTFKKSDIIDVKWSGYKNSNDYKPYSIGESEFIDENEKILEFKSYQDIVTFAQKCLVDFHKHGKGDISKEILNVLQSGESDTERLIGLGIVFRKITSENTSLSLTQKSSIERAISFIEKETLGFN